MAKIVIKLGRLRILWVEKAGYAPAVGLPIGPQFSCSCGASGRGRSDDHKCLTVKARAIDYDHDYLRRH